jgi:membrane-associated protease RseP (regulator of RpoE activity)
MITSNFEIILVVTFFSLIAIRLFLKRKEIRVEKIVILEYSKRYAKKINEVVVSYPKILKIIGILALGSAPLLTFVGIYYLINSLVSFKPSVALVLPTISTFRYPGPIISVPFWIWIVAIFIIVFSHESLHALIAASEGIKTKRYGLLYFLIIPIGAFVDIDEKKLERMKIKSKIKIFAGGSFGNLIVFGFFIMMVIIFSYLINFFLESKGVWFNNTAPNSPAESVGLRGVIVRIDNKTIMNVYDLQEFLKETKPNTTITIETTEGKYKLTLEKKDNTSYIGIVGVKNYIVYKGTNKIVSENLLFLINYLFLAFQWISFLSLGVAIANMLPILPLDGGLIIREILKETWGEKGEKISQLISAVFLILLFFSLFLSSLTLRVVS